MAIIDTRATLLGPDPIESMSVNQDREQFELSETFQRAKANGQDPHVAFEMNAPPLPPETVQSRSQEVDESELLANLEWDDSEVAFEDATPDQQWQQPGVLFNHAARTVHDWFYQINDYEHLAAAKYGMRPMKGTTGEFVSDLEPNRPPFNKSFLAKTPAEVSQFGLEWIGHLEYSDVGMLGGFMQSDENTPPEVLAAQAAMMEVYEKLPMGTFKGSVRMFKNLVLNPSTFAGVGSLAVFKNLLAAGGREAIGQNIYKRLLKIGLGAGAISAEGAGWAGYATYVNQKIKHGSTQERGAPFKPNWDQVLAASALGTAIAGGLTAGIAGAPLAVQAAKGLRQTVRDTAAEGGATLRMGVGPTLDDARLDTRQTRDAIQERLAVLVPPESRVSTGQKYVPGQPDGTPWSALPDEDLARPGPGWTGTDTDIDRMLEEAIAESSAAAQTAAAKTNFSMTMRSEDWDRALRLPTRAQLWYELSGEAFKSRIPWLTKSSDNFTLFTDIVGVTSPREKPLDNLRRSLAVLSQHMRGVAMDVDLTNPTGVTAALGRQGQGSAVASGNKTGHFSDTVALTGGADVPAPIPVNDVWVGKIFNVSDDELMSNQSLHEPMAIFWNKMRDHVNAQGGGQFPHESWQLQSRAWVERRGAQDDYAQVLDPIVEQLRAAGIKGITPDGKITEQALRDPGFVDAIRPTVKPFREAPKATIEVGTTQTPLGMEAARVATQVRARVAETNDPKDRALLDQYNQIHTSALYHATRGDKNPFQQVYNHVTGQPPAAKLTRVKSPHADRPFDIAGSFNGVISPNVRVPLRGMSENQVTLFNAMVGKGLRQDAMATSRIRVLDFDPGTTVAADMVEGRSIFIPMTEPLDGAKIEQFYKLLPEGFEISTDRVPNGYVIDINPRFGDDGPVGATSKDIRKAVKYLANDGLKPEIMRHEYKSVYKEAAEYDEVIGKHREELLNGVVKELNDKFGWTEARSRRFINGRGMGKVTKNVRQKVTRIRARYKGRLGNIDAGIEAHIEVSDTVDKGYQTWLSKQGLDAP